MIDNQPDLRRNHRYGAKKYRSSRAFSRFIVILFALIPLIVTHSATSARAENPILKPQPKLLTETLDNGLTVIVIPSSHTPIVTIEIAVKNGAFTETPELSGLSHLFEHMFFKSNAVIPNQEAYMDRLHELGIVFNGTTGDERVNYFFTLPSSNLKPGLKFMYDAITSVKFEPEEFQKEKEVVVGEIDRNEANPFYWFHTAMSDALFYKYPNRKNALGTRESVRAATVKMMQTMKDTYYVPNNSVLIIAGGVDPQTAFADAKTQFSSWKKGPNPFIKHKVPVHPPLKENKYLIVNQLVNRPYFQMMWQGPSVTIDPKATYAADILSMILTQPESTFQKALVDSQIAYSANLSYYTQANVGPISATLSTPPDKLFDAITILVQQIEKMKNPSYFDDTSLQNAKVSVATQQIYLREQPSSFAHTISFWWSVVSTEYFENYLENMRAITKEDLSNFVKKYISGKHFVAGLLANDPQSVEFGYTKDAIQKTIESALSESVNQSSSNSN